MERNGMEGMEVLLRGRRLLRRETDLGACRSFLLSWDWQDYERLKGLSGVRCGGALERLRNAPNHCGAAERSDARDRWRWIYRGVTAELSFQ